MMTDKPKPTGRLRMPLKNFKHLGELSRADVEWWLSFGRHLQAAHREFDKRQ